MRRSAAVLGALASSALSAKVKMPNLIDYEGVSVSASVVTVNPAGTTYTVNCLPFPTAASAASACSVLQGVTVTVGSEVFAYTATVTTGSYAGFANAVSCSLGGTTSAVCSNSAFIAPGITQGPDVTEALAAAHATETEWTATGSDWLWGEVGVTAGAAKLTGGTGSSTGNGTASRTKTTVTPTTTSSHTVISVMTTVTPSKTSASSSSSSADSECVPNVRGARLTGQISLRRLARRARRRRLPRRQRLANLLLRRCGI
ncbi:hypothetical protein EJ06DRAFT_529938 [Trichodelitschia bisporula]|uniref:Uncharacterized protein n=1 Tax=Trichodelitschia bisporula TaxID=703511 RepID=A0A6G1HXT6_9PEZI|nr:hypothetical protein EJ06DRAFT_529938 [Trichodelitschia bisporula]